MFTQLVLVEFENNTPGLCRITSSKPIDMERVGQFFIEKHDFDMDSDCLTFMDDPEEINIDD